METSQAKEETPVDHHHQQQQEELSMEQQETGECRRKSVQFSLPEGDESPSKKSAAVERTHPSNTTCSNEPDEVVAKPTGSLYSKREYGFVLLTGVFMAFNSGYVNGSCLSGFLAPSERTQATSSFTIIISQSALALADGEFDRFSFLGGMTLSFMFGACLSGILTPDPTPYRIEPTYGPTFLLGAAFLVASSVLAALERNEDWVFFLAACANGIQNGVTSAYSENLIRSTGFTGPSSDIAIYIAQLCRGDTTNIWRLTVLTSLLLSFWVGGIVSFYSARRLTSFSLLINAGLFVVIGVSLVIFLVWELGISVKSALLGTWEWKKAIDMLHTVFEESSVYYGGTDEERFDDLFDRMDKDQNGSITAEELFQGLNASGVAVSLRQCKKMVKHADKDKNGVISRAEWLDEAQKSSRKLRRSDVSRQRMIFSRLSSMRNQGSRSSSLRSTSRRLETIKSESNLGKLK